jgi:hypothetical protein
MSGVRGWFLGLCVGVTMLSGCSAAADVPGSGGAGAAARSAFAQPKTGGSWMAARLSKKNLLYVSNLGTQSVTAYVWGSTGRLVGRIDGLRNPRGLCADTQGNVYVTDSGTSQIFEYAHGGTSAIKTLTDPYGSPTACAVDRSTGNLAVSTQGSDSGADSLAVYSDASGTPAQYTDAGLAVFDFVNYDDRGDLFVDGVPPSGAFALAELKKGAGTLTSVSLNAPPPYVGGLQWDGKYLALGYRSDPTWIYEYSISGSSGTEVNETFLNDSDWILAFCVPKFGCGEEHSQGKRLVGVDAVAGDANYWVYPSGGSPIKTILAGISNPQGVAVSIARP